MDPSFPLAPTGSNLPARPAGGVARSQTGHIPSHTARTDLAAPATCVDPSAALFIAQLHRDGLNPYTANNAVADGIRMVSSLPASYQLRVHTSCAGWIEEIGSYSWDPAAERGIDAPVKTADHSLDAVVTTEALWRGALALAA